ncbi:DNA-directed RNA polymerases IV and V subunit 2, partial [Mucuna pruriens]
METSFPSTMSCSTKHLLKLTSESLGGLQVPRYPHRKGINKHHHHISVKFSKVAYNSETQDEVRVQVYVLKKVRSGEPEAMEEESLNREILKEDDREIIIGRMFVMVKTDLCRAKGIKWGNHECDHENHPLLKGTEKTLVAQNQLYLKRPWIVSVIGCSNDDARTHKGPPCIHLDIKVGDASEGRQLAHHSLITQTQE